MQSNGRRHLILTRSENHGLLTVTGHGEERLNLG